jgi:hypothetical protein
MANNAEGCGLAIFAADPVWAAPCIIAAAIYENPGISWDGLEALAGPPPDVPAPPPPNPPQPLAESSVPLATTPALAASATAASSSALAGASGPTVTAVPVVSNDGGSVVSNDGGSVVSNDGGSLLSEHGNGFSGDSLELMNSALADQTSTVVDQINAMNQDQQTQINAMNQDQQNQIFSDQQQAAADSQAAQTASEPVLNAYAGDQ